MTVSMGGLLEASLRYKEVGTKGKGYRRKGKKTNESTKGIGRASTGHVRGERCQYRKESGRGLKGRNETVRWGGILKERLGEKKGARDGRGRLAKTWN